jgi:hypothetical protein
MCEWPLRFWWPGPHPLDGPVHGGSSDPEEFGELSLGVPRVVQLQQVLGLVRLELRLLSAQPALGLGYFHSFSGAQSDQVGFELGHHRQHVEQQSSDGSVGSWIEPPRLSFTLDLVSSSNMSRASGSDLASRSSLVTTRVSPARHAARANRSPGRSRFVPVRPWST